MRFFPFGCIWDVSLLHETQCKMGQPGAINAKVCATKSRKNFSNERSQSTQLDPKLILHTFLSIWVHSGPIRYHTKLEAKQAKQVQLMQKFVPRYLVRIFLNERSRSTPLDHKLVFSCVSFCLGAFGTISLLHKIRSKMGHTGTINAKVRDTISCWNYSQRTLPIHTI